jgi:hypothetical protein
MIQQRKKTDEVEPETVEDLMFNMLMYGTRTKPEYADIPAEDRHEVVRVLQ